MAYIIEQTLPTADKVVTDLPLDEVSRQKVLDHQSDIKAILEGKDTRKILVIGPCSAWPSESVIEYAEKLQALSQKHEKCLKIVMRTYLQKPRTTIGWLGPLTQPNPLEEANLDLGIYYCREMMIEIARLGLAMADEALFTHNDSYFVDLLSWLAIGARSSEDQEHRIFASMIPHPIGIKHPTSGDLQKGINSIIAAQSPHVFALHKQQIRTSGNPYAHMILRGGNGETNYQMAFIQKAFDLMGRQNIQNPSLIVDLSHENSIDPESGKKDPQRQPLVLQEVLQTMQSHPHLNNFVKGFMAESFLLEGQQDISQAENINDLVPGRSITDACLSWEQTEHFIESLAQQL